VNLSTNATEAQIQSALNGLPDGGKLILAAHQTIAITNGLVMDVAGRSITLDLNGSTLQQADDVTVLTVKGQNPTGQSATLGHDAAGQLTLSTAGAPNAVAGQWVKIYSDDVLPSDQGDATRLGQAMQVASVSGNTLTLKGELLDESSYATNIRVASYVGGTPTVQNGTIRGDQSHPDWLKDLVQVRSTVHADLNHLTVRDGNSMGINIVNSVHATVSQSAVINLTDDPTTGHNGYGVHSASSTGTTVQGLYADQVRHATDDNAVGAVAGSTDPSRYGADIGLTASDVVASGTSAPAFSWHSEGRAGLVSDSVVFDSYGVLGARGVGNAMRDVSGTGNARGITFYEYGDGDGRDISVDNVHLSNLSVYAYATIGEATNNLISNSSFDVLSAKIWDTSGTSLINSLTNIVSSATQVSSAMVTGGAADDRLLGTALADSIAGGDGGDYIWGGLGADLLNGGAGRDRFAYLSAGEGGDVITGFTVGAYGDAIDLSVLAIRNGWSGDIFAAGYVALVQSGADTLVRVDANGGGDGFVTLATLRDVSATDARANISTEIRVTGELVAPVASDSNLVLAAPVIAQKISGTAGADSLVGGAGNDTLSGLDGDDILTGGAGADTLYGGAGRNSAGYGNAGAAVVVDLDDGTQDSGDAEGDVFSGISGIIGSNFDDVLRGGSGSNAISGGAGNDLIDGRSGSDTLSGGAGDDIVIAGAANDRLAGDAGRDRLASGSGYDTLTGGDGVDVFVFNRADTGWDTITDFRGDQIELAGFGVTSMAQVSFVSGSSPTAVGTMPTLLYNSDDGTLCWDGDGAGRGIAAVKIAALSDHPTLTASDFLFG
jgi:Ca2+-binding RTX toxin-like protein